DARRRRDSCARSGGLGPVLQLASHVATIACRELAEIPRRLRTNLEVVPSDVRKHRDCHRQRAREQVGVHRANHCCRLPPPVYGQADARSGNSRRTDGGARRVTLALALALLVLSAGHARAGDQLTDAQALFYDGRYAEASALAQTLSPDQGMLAI